MKHRLLLLLAVMPLWTGAAPSAHPQTPAVVTRAFTNDRAGANLQETVLTPNLLTTQGIDPQDHYPRFRR